MISGSISNSVFKSLRCTHAHDRAGFTLTELAIVVGVAGLVLGALWATVGPVYERIKKEQATEVIAVTVRNVRAFYLGLPGMAAGNQTAFLLQRAVIPPETITDKSAATLTAQNPWGGGFQIFPEPNAANAQSFRVIYTQLPRQACIALGSYYIGAGDPPGIQDILVNSVSLTPRDIPTVIARCGATSRLDLIYRLRQQ